MGNSQHGGFKLSDNRIGTFKADVLKHINSNYNMFNEPVMETQTIQQLQGKFDERLGYMNKDQYTEIIKQLIDGIFNDSEYDQEFKTKPPVVIIESTKGMRPFHINIGSLMFLSFLIELELFAMVHHQFKYNTLSNSRANIVPSIFQESKLTSPVRIYRDIIRDTPENILDIFTSRLDQVFERFMNTFVDEYSTKFRLPKSDVYAKIVPINHDDHVAGTFDYIYVSWKEKLCEGDNNKLQELNKLLEETMTKIISTNTKYIAEGTGFFSFVFLYYNDPLTDHFGSCITYSMFEIYVMSRLHIHGNNINLVLESAQPRKPHEYWINTQKKLGIPSVTHWTSKFKLMTGDIHFRSVFNNTGPEYNLMRDRDNIIRALIYPIYDSYMIYIKDLPFVAAMKKFVDNRIEVIENLILQHKQQVVPIAQPIPVPPPPIIPVVNVGIPPDDIVVENQKYFNCTINTLDGQLAQTSELYDYIEKYTKDLFETIIKGNIDKGNNPIKNYVILGGKAINTVVSRKFLDQSFDFDMHIYDSVDDRDISTFGRHVSKKINEFLLDDGARVFRFFLYQILLHHQLITPNQRRHYMKSKLFYFGERVKTGFGIKIKGLFVHLKLRPDLILNAGGNSLGNPPVGFNTNDGTGPSIDLFYPLADIDLEQHLNFKVLITDRGVIQSYSGLKYAKFVYLLHNLIRYVQKGGFKQDKNFRKLQYLVDPTKHTCSFTLNNSTHALDLLADLRSMNVTQLIGPTAGNVQILNVNGRDIFDPTMRIYDALNEVIMTIQTHRETALPNTVSVCRDRIVLDMTYGNKNKITTDLIFNNPVQYDNLLTSLESMTYDSDAGRYLLLYTGDAYKIITRFLQYSHFGYNVDGLAYGQFNAFNNGHLTPPLIKPLVDKNFMITRANIQNTCDEISNTFNSIRLSGRFDATTRDLKDIITVYRLTTFFAYETINGELFNPSVFKKNCIVYVPHFQSTSFSTNFSYTNFLYETSMVLKINIPKTSRKWAFMNKYSVFPNECEILLDKEMYYVTTGWDYVPVRSRQNVPQPGIDFIDVPMVEVLCFDTLNDATAYVNTHPVQVAQIGGGYDDKVYCVNMKTRPNAIAEVRKLLGPKREVVDFGNVYDVPKDELMKMDNVENIQMMCGEYMNMVLQSDSDFKRIDDLNPSEQNKEIDDKYSNTKLIMERYKQEFKPIQDYRDRNVILREQAFGVAAAGGSMDDMYYRKYLKYKQKYLHAKNLHK